MKGFLGMTKLKGGVYCLHPSRFIQLSQRMVHFYELLKMDVLAYCIFGGKYWLIVREEEGKYCRVPFARNEYWFNAITSDIEFIGIRNLPQIFIVGTG